MRLTTPLRGSLAGLRCIRGRILAALLLCAGLGVLLFVPWLGTEPVPGDPFEHETSKTVDSDGDGMDVDLELRLHRRLQDRVAVSGAGPRPFTTDGCSGGLSVGWVYLAGQSSRFGEVHGGVPPWEHCCVEHDRAYHRGAGPGATALESFAAREQADRALHACVLGYGAEARERLRDAYDLTEEQVGTLYRAIAHSMHRAVRLGGMPCTGLSWRWGYGWPEC